MLKADEAQKITGENSLTQLNNALQIVENAIKIRAKRGGTQTEVTDAMRFYPIMDELIDALRENGYKAHCNYVGQRLVISW